MSLVWYFRDWSYAGLSSTPESRVVFFEIELFDIFSRASCCFSLLKHAAACCHYLLLLYTSRCFKYLSSLVLCRCRLFYLLPAFASCDMFSASCRCLLPPLVIARFLRLLMSFLAVFCCSLHSLVLYAGTPFTLPTTAYCYCLPPIIVTCHRRLSLTFPTTYYYSLRLLFTFLSPLVSSFSYRSLQLAVDLCVSVLKTRVANCLGRLLLPPFGLPSPSP